MNSHFLSVYSKEAILKCMILYIYIRIGSKVTAAAQMVYILYGSYTLYLHVCKLSGRYMKTVRQAGELS